MRIVRRLTVLLAGLILSILGLSVMEWPATYGLNSSTIGHVSAAWYVSPGFDVAFGTVALLIGLTTTVLGFRKILLTGKLH